MISQDHIIIFIDEDGEVRVVVNNNELTEEQAEVLENIATTINEPSFILLIVLYLEKLFNRFSDWIGDYLYPRD
tara:strand:+ start:199 stop:420 length:222 start_codon:yes stop_codon:yes gene_type:complete